MSTAPRTTDTPTHTPAHAPDRAPDRARDEAGIRALYAALLESWGDARAYTDHFTPDADYIVSSGVVERGREEMIAGHEQIFTTWARGTRLTGEIGSIRFIAPDVAFVIARGTMLLPGETEADPADLTIYSLVAVREGSGWRFAGYQNTPVQEDAA